MRLIKNMQNLNTKPVMLPIKKIVKETETIWTFVFSAKVGDWSLASKPGQFVMLWVPGVEELPLSIAYDDGKEFWLTVAKVGEGTEALFKMKVGEVIGIKGPFGTSYEFKKGERLALMAGGYGAAPMYCVAVEALKIGCSVDFIVGARSKDLLLYKKRVENLAKKYGATKIKYYAATNDGTFGHKGFNTEILEEILASGKGKKISRAFACGPEMMMKRVAEIAAKAKVNCQISLERYMKCGFGVCGQCCVDDTGECVCTSGPVYDGAKALKLKEFGKYHRDSVGRKKEW